MSDTERDETGKIVEDADEIIEPVDDLDDTIDDTADDTDGTVDDADDTVDIMDELSDDGSDVDGIEETDASFEDGRVTYECSAWAGESRGLLGSLLTTQGIRHAWQGTTLSVHEDDEDTVDALIDDVLTSARPALDPAADKVAYEVGTWSASFLTTIGERLTAGDISYEYDEQGDLVVYADDEEAVEAIFESLPDPDDAEIDENDGLSLHQTLDELFMAADKLARSPEDAGSVIAVDEATVVLESISLPFGFDRRQWHALVGRCQALRIAIEASSDDDGALDDDEFRTLATEVRDLVRQYI